MALYVTYNDDSWPVELVSPATKQSGFVCRTDHGQLEVKYPLEVNNYFDPENFSLFYLVSHDLKENDIYQVFDKGRDVRIGWCFPVQALDSKEHSFQDNEHFLRYAYVAATKIFTASPDDLFTNKPPLETPSEYKLTDFFTEEVALFVVSLETLQDTNAFCIRELLPSIYKYGYTRLSSRTTAHLASFGRRPERVRMNLISMSNGIERIDFIEKAYVDLLPYESDPFVSFFYFYQIFELLISQIFTVEQGELVQELVDASSDSVKTKELLRKASEISSEQERLKMLFDRYTEGNVDSRNLHESCNNLLTATGRQNEENPVKSFYKIRNVLFHQYRDVQRMDLLDIVIADIPGLLEEVLHFYPAKGVEEKFIEKRPDIVS